ncbi:MAG: IS3 family transposase [Acidimicrobiales bacterium]
MIDDAMATFPAVPVTRLCTLFGVSRSGYYAYRGRSICGEEEREVLLRDAIERLVLDFPGYGYRRVTRQLQRDGWNVNHKRALRVMREESLLCQLKKRFVTTTNSGHAHPVYPNLLANRALDGLNQAWVADVTYIRLPTTFVYLAAILDGYSRRCIGWALSRWIDTRLTLTALDMALIRRCPLPGFIHHSDRGVQYAAGEYVARLEAAGAQISMSAVGNPYDNAKAESFFKTLKREEVYLKEYRTFEEAEANLERFIEAVYNTKRLHSSLGYLPPVEFEAAQARNAEELTFATVR